MTKKAYIAILIFLIFIIITLSFFELNYTPMKIKGELIKNTQEIITFYPDKAEFQNGGYEEHSYISDRVWENNIFNSKRNIHEEQISESTSNIELIGILKGGSNSGCIFMIKDNNSSNQGTNSQRRMYYFLGNKLPNGMTIKLITDNSVELQGSEGIVTLKFNPVKSTADQGQGYHQSDIQRTRRQVNVISEGIGDNSSNNTEESSNNIINNKKKSNN